jgi:hypothetical protein
MRENKAPLQKHLSHIPQAQRIAQTPEDDEPDNVRGGFERVKRGASSFMKKTLTFQAEKCSLPRLVFFARCCVLIPA